jgi:hypothetical protein
LGDVEVLTARGTFYADRGRLDAAVTDFTAAMAQAPRGSRRRDAFGPSEQIEGPGRERDKVFERMVAATPTTGNTLDRPRTISAQDLLPQELSRRCKAVELDQATISADSRRFRCQLAGGEAIRKMC